MIEREEIRFIAAADWTDDCRVRLELRKRVTTLTIAEAKALRSELDAAIAEASRGADELRHEHEPAAFDLLGLMSPDCTAGKHRAGWQDTAWDLMLRSISPNTFRHDPELAEKLARAVNVVDDLSRSLGRDNWDRFENGGRP